MSLWGWMPMFVHAVYWHKKEKFQFLQDSYPDWVMFAVEGGAFRYTIGEAAGTAKFGDAILCPPGTVFEREVVEPVSFHFIRLGWQRADGLPAGAGEPEQLPIHLTWMDSNRLSSTYLHMHHMNRLPVEYKSVLWNHYLQDLWQQYTIEKELSKTEHKLLEQSRINPVMLEAAKWLQQHASQPIVIKQLSSSLGLSSVQFTRKFHAAHGVTPIHYLTSLRIQKAQTLLVETELTLEQIADRCGYENGFYLSRVFSKRMKRSPTQYRRDHRV